MKIRTYIIASVILLASVIGFRNVMADNYLSNGLVGYWSFDNDTIVNNVKDLSGQGNNGILQPTNATSSMKVAGKIGQGLKFNGVNQYVSTSDTALDSGAITISAWIYPKVTTGVQRIVNNNSKTIFQIANTGSRMGFTSSGGTVKLSAANSIVANKWNHVLVTRDSTGALTNLYVNGVLSGTPNQDSGTPAAGSSGVLIGNQTSLSTGFLGIIDDVRIFNRALSSTEVYNLYRWGLSKRNNY